MAISTVVAGTGEPGLSSAADSSLLTSSRGSSGGSETLSHADSPTSRNVAVISLPSFLACGWFDCIPCMVSSLSKSSFLSDSTARKARATGQR
jgi:hypothetical protein